MTEPCQCVYPDRCSCEKPRPLTKRQREVFEEIGRMHSLMVPYGAGSRPFHTLKDRGLITIRMSVIGRGYRAELTPLGKEVLDDG